MPYATNEKRRAAYAEKREVKFQADGQAKRCSDCGDIKPLTAFRCRGGSQAHLYKSHCNSCLYRRHKAWSVANPDRVQEYREKNSWTLAKRCARRGISPEQLADRYELQEKCCAICKVGVALIDSAIDHNHETGEFRGVLCKQCNRALGMFKDSPAVLRSAVKYLEAFGSYGDAAQSAAETVQGQRRRVS